MGASAPRKIHTSDGVLLVTAAGLTKQGESAWTRPREAFVGVSFTWQGHGNEVWLHTRDGSNFRLYGVPAADVLRLIEMLSYEGTALPSPGQPASAATGDTEGTAKLTVSCAQGQLVITGSHVWLVGESPREIPRADLTGFRPHVTRSGCDLVLATRDGQQLKVTGLARADALNAIRLLVGAEIGSHATSAVEQSADAGKPSPSRDFAPPERISQPSRMGQRRSLVGGIPDDLSEARGGAHTERVIDHRAAVMRADDRRKPLGAIPVASVSGSSTPGHAEIVTGLDAQARGRKWRIRDILAVVLGAIILLWAVLFWARASLDPASPTGRRWSARQVPAVYVGSRDGAVYALDAGNGMLVWRHMTGGAVESCPTFASGVLYAGSDNGSISALRVRDQAVLWQFRTGGKVMGTPAVTNGVVYAGSTDDSLYALQASDGSLLWRYSAHNWFASQPTVADGLVYAGNYDGNIYTLDARTGAVRWSFRAGAPAATPPAIAGGILYAASADGIVYALNARTGALLWRYATDGSVYSSPAVVGGVLYVGSFDGTVYALSTRERKVLWQYQTGGPIASSPAVVGGVLYVGSFDGTVYALRADSGAIVWHFNTGDSVAGSPAVANNAVYVGS
ncbi:MAG TPA: PQQ-binding-like beta-propeller repeat protein, partial [Ktedonobacterales bacterium]|nr:PQQ-binding-like beta-propeller repeat protein [Ktedonobacterales bacterium]